MSLEIYTLLKDNFPFEPTQDQIVLMEKMTQFLITKDQKIFILNGYAGTGKTSFVKSLVKSLQEINVKSLLMAPTGRAAKVLSNYSNKQAFTVHSIIYKLDTQVGIPKFILTRNKAKNTLLIVDEASMLNVGKNSQGVFQSTNLLEDLIHFMEDGDNCKLMLIGDVAQLPPVGQEKSFALSPKFIKTHFHTSSSNTTLKEVKRQDLDSGILFNATYFRQLLTYSEIPPPRFDLSFEDIQNIQGNDLEDELSSAYTQYGFEETLIITKSNKRANLFNRQIRSRIIGRDEYIEAGDMLMVVRNNYNWLSVDSKAGFIANGDTIEILSIQSFEELDGFQFANATIRLIDYPNEPELDVKLLTNTLDAETPSLSQTESKKLFDIVIEKYADIKSNRMRYLKAKEDPYLNAIQVKFAYAVTCHKAQGGQWNCVFVDQGYLTMDGIDRSYIRWLYTAITRAKQKICLVNFHPRLTGEEIY